VDLVCRASGEVSGAQDLAFQVLMFGKLIHC
jgi:hypothetical protein